MTDKKLNIFTLLEKADKKDYNYFKKLSDEDKMEFCKSAYIITKWANSATSNSFLSEYLILMANETYNKHYWELNAGNLESGHPELFWKLLCSMGTGSTIRRGWIGQQTKSKDNSELFEFFNKYWTGINKDEFEILVKTIDENKFEELLETTDFGKKDVTKKLREQFTNARI